MPRQGLSREIILNEAVRFINERGYQKLTLAVLADMFNVKPPAMFKHFKNINELKETLALFGIRRLKQNLQDAVTGKAGDDALSSLCHAYRDFAKANRGVYQAIQPSHFGKNKEIEQASFQLMTVIINVLKGFKISEENFIHLLRIIRSSLHGFVVLELEFGFGMSVNINISFDHQIKALILLIKSFKD